MRFSLSFLFIVLIKAAYSQSVYAPFGRDYYHLTDRYEILNGGLPENFHSVIKPYQKSDIAAFISNLSIDSSRLSKADRFNITYLSNDNWLWSTQASLSRKPVLGLFYQRPSDLLSVNTEDFALSVNPVLYLAAGKNADGETLLLNTRGAEVSGLISKKLGFYSFIAENQGFFPGYVDRYIRRHRAVPGEGYTKGFKEGGYDYITARGYIVFSPIKHIQMQFGHGNNFIGNGYRSLILSDFAGDYTFLKVNTKVWKINYTNLFAQLNADVFYLNQLMPKKYLAMHHLSINIGKHLNLGIFESVIFARDSGRGGPEISYLNPIIFYRSIEQQLGSEDNALLGADFKLNFLRRFSLYGQLVLDEFLLKNIKARNGWWANKQAGQLGLKYINVAGIKNLDFQLETNIIRPFTYTHKSSLNSYVHYNHPLAHPVGANLYELLSIVRYQPLNRLNLTAKVFYFKYGADTLGKNYGNDLLLPYTTRTKEFGNKIAGDHTTTVKYISFTATWQLRHNIFFDLTPVVRIQRSELASLNKNDKFVTVAFRWNIPQKHFEF